MSSSDDDDSPEDITFSSSKENALKSIKAFKDSLSRDSKLVKEQRRAVEERNIEQKKRKAIPLEVLEQAEEALENKEALKRALEDKDNSESEEETDEEQQGAEEEKEHEFYVPIAKTQRFNKPATLDAADFKNQHLYRGRIRRVDYNKTVLKTRLARRR